MMTPSAIIRTRKVVSWLDGLRHISSLTQQTVARQLRVYEPRETPLKFESMKLDVLMQRACVYHQQGASQKQIEIICQHTAEVPTVWADRAAVAVVADSLLSNAIRFSRAGGRGDVEILPGPGGVVCSVSDSGPGLTALIQARIFERGAAGGHRGLPGEHPGRPRTHRRQGVHRPDARTVVVGKRARKGRLFFDPPPIRPA
jgi:signal transduction histidine kinase